MKCKIRKLSHISQGYVIAFHHDMHQSLAKPFMVTAKSPPNQGERFKSQRGILIGSKKVTCQRNLLPFVLMSLAINAVDIFRNLEFDRI